MDSTLSQVALQSGRARHTDTPLVVPVRLTSATTSRHQPVRVGIPLPQGSLRGVTSAVLASPCGGRYPAQLTVLATWPDGSIKWLLVEALPITIPPQDSDWSIEFTTTDSRDAAVTLTVHRDAATTTVDTGTHRFSVSPNHADRLIQCRSRTGQDLGCLVVRLADSAQRNVPIRWQAVEIEHDG
jgi:hypothetical protein